MRRQVKAETGYAVDYQNNNDLATIMRYIYITNSCDPYDDIQKQMGIMNSRTVAEITRQVKTGLAQQAAYLRDISRKPEPNALPMNTSTYGNKMGYNDKIGL